MANIKSVFGNNHSHGLLEYYMKGGEAKIYSTRGSYISVNKRTSDAENDEIYGPLSVGLLR
jgi:hypothetical protein